MPVPVFAKKFISSEFNFYLIGFLWLESLDVVSIAPFISTVALGGTIFTDWYANNNIKNNDSDELLNFQKRDVW